MKLGPKAARTIVVALPLFGLLDPVEAKPRCPFGQIYRPSLRICQSKLAKDAQPYVATRKVASSSVKRAGSGTTGSVPLEIRTENDGASPSGIPFVEPRSLGSLNPLPPWKAGL